MSTFTFDPANANPVLPDGEYDAVIFSAKTGQTKKGDPKLEVTLKAYGPNNITPLVTDNIVDPYGIRRLKQLCAAAGLDFDSGDVNPSGLVGKNIRVKLAIQHDETGTYEDQNSVRGYLPDSQELGDVSTPGSAAGIPSQQSQPSSVLATEDSASEFQIPGTIGKREAWQQYCAAVLKKHPDASHDLLTKNFQEACKAFMGGKPIDEYSEADWIKVRDEGPAEFVPF